MRFFDRLLSAQQNLQEAAADPANSLQLVRGLAEAVLGLALLSLAIRLAYGRWGGRETREGHDALLAILSGAGLAAFLVLFAPAWAAHRGAVLECTLLVAAAGTSLWAAVVLLRLLRAPPKIAEDALDPAAFLELAESYEEMRALYGDLKQREEARTELLADFRHELRTPLTLIAGPVEQLLRREDLPDDVARDLLTISRNAALLTRHVNDLASLALHEGGELVADYTEVDAAALVRRTCESFAALAEDRGVQLVTTAPGALFAELDEGKIEQVLVNLLYNAFKAAPEGGVVRCELAGSDDGLVRLLVGDSGPGIPAQQREEVFERFRQLKASPERDDAGGSGLGLAIARALVCLHAGRITIGDAPEGGALFVVELPRTPPEGPRAGHAAAFVRRSEGAEFTAANLPPE